MSAILHNSKRRGFTLVELLVVIAIIATLIGLLLPAVQSAREAARRTGCGFNIRGLAQAVQVYESTKRRLPAVTDRNEAASRSGIWAASGTAATATGSGYSWIFHILPYMEEGAMYNNVSGNTSKFQFGPFSVGTTLAAGGAWTGQNWTGSHAAAVVIAPLLCPSSGGGSFVETTATGTTQGLSYASEYATFETSIGSNRVAVTNYKAMAGTHMNTTATPIVPVPNGAIQFAPDVGISSSLSATPYFASRPGVSAGALSDGMSKTVMIAETKERGYSSWIDGTACWVVAYDPNLGTATNPTSFNGQWSTTSGSLTPITSCALSVQPTLLPAAVRFLPTDRFPTSRVAQGMAYGPSSDHQGGIVLHAYGDTHVSQVTSDIDPNVYLSISSRNGGEAVAEVQ